jgi:tripartite-type tricarboxylate transporter receptor subunit TctC
MKSASATLFAMLLLAPVSNSAHAENFPNRTLTMIIPFAPGGVTDQVARIVAAKVSDNIGQPIVIENRAGGGGQIAAGAVKQAKPDGYTLMVGDIGTHAINTSLYAKLTYDAAKDFAPITELVEMPHVLAVPAESPFKTIADLVAGARARPGSLTFGSVGVGSGAHLLGEMLKSQQGLDIIHAPYRGSSQVTPDLLSGRIGLFFGSVFSMAPLIKDGKLRGLVVTDQHRAALLPNIPSAVEVGMPDLDLKVWLGLFAPAETPVPVINKLNAEFVKVLRLPEMSERLKTMEANVIASSPEEFRKVLASETVRMGDVVRNAGARLD